MHEHIYLMQSERPHKPQRPTEGPMPSKAKVEAVRAMYLQAAEVTQRTGMIARVPIVTTQSGTGPAFECAPAERFDGTLTETELAYWMAKAEASGTNAELTVFPKGGSRLVQYTFSEPSSTT